MADRTDLEVLLLDVSRVVGAVVVGGQTLAHHPVVGVRPGADVARPQSQSGGGHGLLHGGAVEQHGTVAREPAVQLVSGALQVNTVSDRDQMLQPRGKSMQFSSKICINVEQVK